MKSSIHLILLLIAYGLLRYEAESIGLEVISKLFFSLVYRGILIMILKRHKRFLAIFRALTHYLVFSSS